MHFGAAYAGYRGIPLVAISSFLAAAALARAGSRSAARSSTRLSRWPGRVAFGVRGYGESSLFAVSRCPERDALSTFLELFASAMLRKHRDGLRRGLLL